MPVRLSGSGRNRKLRAAAAAFLLTAAFLLATTPARAADPAQVTLDGEWQLDRSEHDPCFMVVPPVVGGSMHLEADFEVGTVEGWLQGSGVGTYTLPRTCDRLHPTEYELARPTTYEAELTAVEMTFSGRLDPETGEFWVEGTLRLEGGGSYAAPDYQYSCVPGGLTTSCPLYEFGPERTGTISGIVQGTGVNRGEIDWPLPYCGLVSPTDQGSTVDWGNAGCPTIGEWEAAVTEVVWRANRPPEIQGIGASPTEPTSDHTVTFTVDAADPDDDPLAYAWYVDGSPAGSNAPSLTWPNPTSGSHEIRVTVSDGAETVEASLEGFPVTEPAGSGGPGDGAGTDPDEGEPIDEVTSSVANPPADQEQGSAFSALSGDGDASDGGEWSAPGIAILILFLILMALAAGLPLKAAISAVLVSGVPTDVVPPSAAETAALARDVGAQLSNRQLPTGTVGSPVQPWSSASGEAPRADFVLQPGEPFIVVGGQGTGADAWVQVRQGENLGWVHQSAVAPWQEEVITRPLPPTQGDPYRETVGFPDPFLTRDPTGANLTRRDPGIYDLGSPDTGGNRPVYDREGKLIGNIPADQVPDTQLRRGPAPEPPPPPP